MAPDQVRAQLQRLLASPLLAPSARLSAFLRFVVEASLDGRADSLKEYAIGVEVFERGADFDPRIDNVVRIQAAKLRSKLVEFYAGDGASDPIVITIPKGSYAPDIQARPVAVALTPAPAAPPDKSRIVVLPFVNMSSDPENEYFSDGLTEELINRLACNSDLQVVARTSAFRFKGRNEDLREVGAKLNVGTVLEGSVRRAGSQVRVTAQLIDVATGFHLFSRTYQREFKDIFKLQDEVAEAVVREIAPLHAAPQTAVKTNTTNLEAYNAYLRGMFGIANRYVDLDRAIEHFREAIRLDPNYAPAWAGLAQGYFLIAWFYRMPAHEVMPLAREAAMRASELGPDLAQAQSSRAVVECVYEWNWRAADERFRRTVDLQPGFGGGSLFYAFCCLMPQLRSEEACTILERALAADPYNPVLHAGVIVIYGRAGRIEQAVRQYELSMDYAPQYPPLHGSGGLAYELSGEMDKAIAAYRLCCKLTGDAPYPRSALSHALAVAGEVEEARQIAMEMAANGMLAPADTARAFAGLRDEEETLRWLETACDHGSLHLIVVAADHCFQWLRPNPRFQRILQRMNLANVHAAAQS